MAVLKSRQTASDLGILATQQKCPQEASHPPPWKEPLLDPKWEVWEAVLDIFLIQTKGTHMGQGPGPSSAV